MTRYMFIVAALSCALTGCATTGPTRGVVTPWGGLAVHSFNGPKAQAPDAKAVNAEVARLLDDQDEGATRVAAR